VSLLILKKDCFEAFKCKNCFSVFSNFEYINNKNNFDSEINTDKVSQNSIKFYQLPRFLLNRYTFKITANFDFNYISKQMDLKKIENSLDIGCQYGFLVKKLQDVGIVSHGIEAFQHPYSVCENRITYEYFTENYNSNNKKYDLITMGDIVYLNPNSIKLINKAVQMLNKNGFLVITGFNPSTKIISEILKRSEDGYQNYTSKKGYECICKSLNCSLIDFSTFNPKLFSINLTKNDKLCAGFEILKCILRLDDGFKKQSSGIRSYTLIKKNS